MPPLTIRRRRRSREAQTLTLFACPKPSGDAHVQTIERNAVKSWTLLPGRPEIILFGDAGAARLAAELGVLHAGGIDVTSTGAPLLDSLFAAAEEAAGGVILAYVNADVVLLSDFAVAVERAAAGRRPFLLVGQRTDVDVVKPLVFEEGWEASLRDRVAREGSLQSHEAIDYFAYRRGFWGEIPPLAVGRASFDNWLLRRARELGAAVVDATPVVTAVHQNHGYGHVAGGKAEVYGGAEADRNMELAGGAANLHFIHDATHVLTRAALLPALAPRYLAQRWRRYSGASAAVRNANRLLLGIRLKVTRLTRTSG